MTWEEQDHGRWLGVATERAVAFAEGDADKLAAVGFAAFLQSKGITAEWFLEDPLTIRVGCDEIGVRADTGTDYDTFTIEDSGKAWTLAARILPGDPPLILLAGLTCRLSDAIETHGPALPTRAFLRVSEWLMRFPHLWRTAA